MKEASEIIEIAFHTVKLKETVELFIKTISNSTLIDYQIATDSSEIDLQSKESVFDSISQSSNGSFYFNFLHFSLGDITLLRAGFQIYKYDSIYDLNLDFEETEIREKISIPDLQIRVESLANDLKVTDYYCGYEPVSDEASRLFSRNKLGPLKNWPNR